MEKIQDVMQAIAQNPSTTNPVRFEMLDQYCESDVHEGKRIQMMRVGETELCPVCHREVENQKLSAQVQENAQRIHEEKQLEQLFQNSLFEDVQNLQAGFKNYRTEPNSEAQANKHRMIDIAKAYASGKVFNTWLYGNPGTGKTHLAIATVRNVNKETAGQLTCAFVNTSQLMQEIRATFSNGYAGSESEKSYIARCVAPDLLVLDDLGAESGRIGTNNQASDFVHRVLYEISSGRQHKITMITTNLTFSELESIYDQKLISRLKGEHVALDFTKTEDRRSKKLDWEALKDDA